MSSSMLPQRRLSHRHLLDKKQRGEKIVTLTAYDYGTAKLIDQTGDVDLILVGDSLGMVLLGYPDTLHVTMDDMLHHVKAVNRGVSRSIVVADMPFMSVTIDLASAIQNCGRMIQEGANAVKIEGATGMTLSLVYRLTEMGIPVMGHLGFTPQAMHTLGGFKVQAKTMAAVEKLVADAQALEAAGAFAVVLEMVPVEVADMVSRMLTIPTIGIGAGAGCDGQILVLDDFLGKYPDFKPKFARRYMQFGEQLQSAVKQYATDINDSTFPNNQTEAFHFPKDELPALAAFETAMRAAKEMEKRALCK